MSEVNKIQVYANTYVFLVKPVLGFMLIKVAVTITPSINLKFPGRPSFYLYLVWIKIAPTV